MINLQRSELAHPSISLGPATRVAPIRRDDDDMAPLLSEKYALKQASRLKYMSPMSKLSALMSGINDVDLKSSNSPSPGGSPMKTSVLTKQYTAPTKLEVPVYLRIECEYFGSETGHAWRVSLKFDFREKKKKDNWVARYIFKEAILTFEDQKQR